MAIKDNIAARVATKSTNIKEQAQTEELVHVVASIESDAKALLARVNNHIKRSVDYTVLTVERSDKLKNDAEALAKRLTSELLEAVNILVERDGG